MSYMPGGSARALADYLEASAEAEELDLPKGEFIFQAKNKCQMSD